MLREDPCPRHIIALHVGDRSREHAQQLWAHMPAVYREQAPLFMDQYEVYTGVMPVVKARTYLIFIPEAHNVTPIWGSQKYQGATGQAPQRAVGESRWGTGPGNHPTPAR